ncbi:hypothetical protein DXG01_015672, partial [Tephrocybe rancida]
MQRRENDSDCYLPDVSEAYVVGLLRQQLTESREQWAKWQARWNEEKGTIETPEEVSLRVLNADDKRKGSSRLRSRALRKLDTRRRTVKKVIALKTEANAEDLEAWKYFGELVEELGVDGMSEDEEAVEKIGNVTIPVFKVGVCEWRAPEITEYLGYIDKETRNEAIREKGGANPTPHIRTQEPSKTQV